MRNGTAKSGTAANVGAETTAFCGGSGSGGCGRATDLGISIGGVCAGAATGVGFCAGARSSAVPVKGVNCGNSTGFGGSTGFLGGSAARVEVVWNASRV